MPPAQLTWIDIEDFTPGIRHRVMKTSGTGSIQPLGAADPEETYRCIALPDGGLAPLPKRTFDYEVDGLEASIGLVGQGRYWITGFHVTGPIDIGKPYAGQDRVEFHFGFGHQYDHDANGSFTQRKTRWEKHNIFLSPVTIDILDTKAAVVISASEYNFPRLTFCDCRMHPTDAAQIGYPLVACGGLEDDYWEVFPDPAAPAVDGVVALPAHGGIERVIQHQGRVVGFEYTSHSHGVDGDWHSNEQLWWTDVNTDTVGMTNAAMLGQGQMSGYGAALSVSAQELLLIKHRGGAISVSGDLDSPTIIAYPGVMSMMGADIIPCYSPIGLIYAVKNGGVYAWQGGDNSLKISSNLDDDFWRISDDEFVRNDGKFDTWGDWVLIPGNWLYDTVTDSWWLIEDRDTLEVFYWACPPLGSFMYGAPQSYVDATTPLAYGWDRATPASSFRWQSQVLAPTVDRVLDVREISLLAAGPVDSAVTITLYTEEGEEQAEIFTITTQDIPRVYRKSTSLKGTAIKVRIDSDSGDTSPAPVVFKVGLGMRENQRVANA